MKAKHALKLNRTSTVLLATVICFLPLIGRGAGDEIWVKKANMPTPRLGLSTCAVNGKIYALGGYARAGASGIKTVEEYDPGTDSWSTKAPMPTARVWFSSATVNGKLYAIGGSRAFLTGPMKTVEEYDPATDTWTRKADMPTARSNHGVGVVNGKIYVLGGATTFGAPTLAVVEAYDPATDTWEPKAKMPTPMEFLGASVVDGKIFAIGSGKPGGSTLSGVERYDPQTDTWTRKSRMPTARGELGCATVNGKIYAIGGRDCCRNFATVEEYDPAIDSWTRKAPISDGTSSRSTPRAAHSTSELNGKVYVLGGIVDVAEPHPGISSVLEYTPPVMPPALQVKLVGTAGQSVLRLEWKSHVDYLDLLQSQNHIQPGAWTEVEKFSGTGETLTKEIPATEPAAFYRLQRELK